MEVWDKKDNEYIKKYEVVNGNGGKQSIRLTFANGESYTVAYSDELEKKLSIIMEKQFAIAKEEGKTKRAQRVYSASKGVGIAAAIVTGFSGLAGLTGDIIGLEVATAAPAIIGTGAVSLVGAIAFGVAKRKKAKEANLVNLRDENKTVLDGINKGSATTSKYPFIGKKLDKGQEPFSIASMEQNGMDIKDLSKAISTRKQELYIDEITSSSIDEIEKKSKKEACQYTKKKKNT